MPRARKSGKTQLMTQKAYAVRAKVTPQYVNKLVRDQVIRLRDGKVDAAQADAARRAKREPARSSKLDHDGHGPRARGGATGELTKNRAKTEYYKAEQAKLDFETAMGKLVPYDGVVEAERRKNQNIRTDLLRLPRAAAVGLAGKSAAEVEAGLMRWCRGLLEKWITPALFAAMPDEVQTPAGGAGRGAGDAEEQSTVDGSQLAVSTMTPAAPAETEVTA